MVQTVQDADGVAIMRLFHEAGGTWFWWSMDGGAQYVRVYKYAFNYLTVTKGLKNMIWLLPYDGSPEASFYPGKSFVDLGGGTLTPGTATTTRRTACTRSAWPFSGRPCRSRCTSAGRSPIPPS